MYHNWRGKIKNPAYNACYQMLEQLGLSESAIGETLQYHGIVSGNEILEHVVTGSQDQSTIVATTRPKNWLYKNTFSDLEFKVISLNKTFQEFVDSDLSRAKYVINNLYNLTQDEEGFDFLCDLFAFDYHGLSNEKRNDILSELRKMVNG